MGRLIKIIIFLFCGCILLGCGPNYHWNASFPLYKKAPYGELSVALSSNAFILIRSSAFARRMNENPDSMQIKAVDFCEKIFLNEMTRAYPKFTRIPDSLIQKAPLESQKIDERIYLKGRIPEQGISLTDETGKTPPVILILHEFMVGADLKRESYFDYALIHNENTAKKTVANLSAIVSYTLWDNERQIALFNGIEEIQKPMTNPSWELIEALVRDAVKQIRVSLYAGARS